MNDYALRTIEKDDLNDLVALHVATYGRRDNSLAAVRLHHERLLDHVLVEPREDAPPIHAMVCTCRTKIVAMVYGAHSPMRLDNARIWATTGTLLAVHPDHRRPECTELLLRALLESDLDLFIADRTNEIARRASVRATTARVFDQYSLRWVRVLSPAVGVLGGLLNRYRRAPTRADRVLNRAMSGVDMAVDRASPQMVGVDSSRARELLTTRPLTAEHLAAHGDALMERFTLRPDLTSAELVEAAWSRFRTLRPEGRFERVGVWNSNDELVGWYVVHMLATGTAEVLQLVGRDDVIHHVITLLFDDAKRLGAGSIHGTASPTMFVPLSEAGASYHGRGSAMLIGSAHAGVLDAFAKNRALISGFEREYPMMLAPGGAVAVP